MKRICQIAPTVLVLPVLAIMLALWGCSLEWLASGAERITPAELNEILGEPDTVVIDVRLGKEWDASDRKIRGAAREDPMDVSSWAGKYPMGKHLVLY